MKEDYPTYYEKSLLKKGLIDLEKMEFPIVTDQPKLKRSLMLRE